MKGKQVFLSVILPSYNEMANFQRGCLDKLIPFLEQQDYRYEIIFSDDGSTDQTAELLSTFISKNQTSAKKGELHLLKNPHGGKVAAVRAGMIKACGKWRLFTDFDQSTEISEVDKLLAYVDEGYDIIFGSRRIDPSQVKAKWYRRFIGDSFNLIVRIITGLKIGDTQCGFKLFSQRGSQLFDHLYVYSPERVHQTGAFTGAYDVELFYLAKKYGLKYKEVQVKWQHFATDRVNLVKDSIKMFCDVVSVRWADFRRRYRSDFNDKTE